MWRQSYKKKTGTGTGTGTFFNFHFFISHIPWCCESQSVIKTAYFMAKRHFKKCRRKTQNRVWRGQVPKQKAAEAKLPHAEALLLRAEAMPLHPEAKQLQGKSIVITPQKCSFFTHFHAFFEWKTASQNATVWLPAPCVKCARITNLTPHPHLLAKIARKCHYEKSLCHVKPLFANIL